MKNLRLFSLLFMAGMLLFISGCQREEVLTEKKSSPEQKLFFENNEYFSKYFPNIQTTQIESRNIEFEAHLKSIKAKLKDLDNAHGIISFILQNYGMPLWGRPLIAENISANLEYAYSFPLLNNTNPLVNGFLKVYKSTESEGFKFEIINEEQIFNKIKTNPNDTQILDFITTMHVLNMEVFNKSKEGYQDGILYYIQSGDSRVQFRSGCWTEIVIFVEGSDGSGHYSTAVGIYYNDRTFSNIIASDVGGKLVVHSNPANPTISIELRRVTIVIWNPDCGDNDGATNWINEFDDPVRGGNGGDGLTPQSQWERLNDINRLKLLACRSWAPDATGGVDVISDSPETDADLAKDCEKIRLMDECLTSGMLSDINIINLLTAIDLGVVSESDLKFIQKQHCGSGTIDQAITKFLECVMEIQSNNPFPDLDFKKYIESFKAIEEFLAAHPNDPVAAQLGVDMKNNICLNGGTGGSGNALKLGDLEYEYVKLIDLSSKDYIYDKLYWQNPNLSFQSQNLPSYQAFFNAFPKWSNGSWMYGADNVYPLVGGDVLKARQDYPNQTNNTCALKVSIALNGAGIQIPSIPGSTLKGADDKYYFLNARALTDWMILTFGAPNDNLTHISFTTFSDPIDFPALFNDKKGIFSGLIASVPGQLSGHVDIFTGTGCSSNSDCSTYYPEIVHLWILE